MYLSNEQLQKKLDRAKQKAISRLLDRNRYYTAQGLVPLVLVDDGLAIPFRPRLGLFKGRNNKVQYNPKTGDAHSYGWWRFVAVIKGKVVFNDYQYSATTRTHQTAIKELLSELGIKIDYVVNFRSSLNEDSFFIEGLKSYYKGMFESQVLLKTARDKARLRKTIRHCRLQIAKLRKAGCKFSLSQQKELKELVEKQNNERLQRKREQRKSQTTQLF